MSEIEPPLNLLASSFSPDPDPDPVSRGVKRSIIIAPLQNDETNWITYFRWKSIEIYSLHCTSKFAF